MSIENFTVVSSGISSHKITDFKIEVVVKYDSVYYIVVYVNKDCFWTVDKEDCDLNSLISVISGNFEYIWKEDYDIIRADIDRMTFSARKLLQDKIERFFNEVTK